MSLGRDLREIHGVGKVWETKLSSIWKILMVQIYTGVDKAILLHHLGNRDVNSNSLIFIDFIVVEEGR